MRRPFGSLLVLGLILALAPAKFDLAAPVRAQAVAEAPASPAAPAAPAAPALNPRYYAIQSKLDQGGSFYLYADVKGDLRKFAEQMRPIFQRDSLPIAVLLTELEHAGFYGVQDIGMSSMPDGSRYLNKFFVSLPEGRTGLLALLGGPAHKITALGYAPADTMLFSATELDVAGLLQFARDAMKNIGGEAVLQSFNMELQKMKTEKGIDIDALANSLAGQFCTVGTLDPTRKATIPNDAPSAQPVQVDLPMVTFIVDTKSSALYDTVRAMLVKGGSAGPEVVEGDLKSFPVTGTENPIWQLSPVIACDAWHFYFSTHAEYLKKVMDSMSAGGGLAQNAEFIAMSAGTPAEGNSMTYMSESLGRTYSGLIKDLVAAAPNQNGPENQFMLGLLDKNFGSFGISCNLPDGVYVVSRSSSSGQAGMVAAASAPILAIMAAISVPNYLEAQTRSKVARAKADQRSMAVALEAYYLDSNAYPAPDNLKGLTTPISYLTTLFPDPFAPDGATFHYYSTPGGPGAKPGWLLWSPGPDTEYNLLPENIPQVYDPSSPGPTPGLRALIFDPTNGTVSSGDVMRIKE